MSLEVRALMIDYSTSGYLFVCSTPFEERPRTRPRAASRQERQTALEANKLAAAAKLQEEARENREEAKINSAKIAEARKAEKEAALLKRNEVRTVEAHARERKLREKELMIAHLQQRAAQRQQEEAQQAEVLDTRLRELEREEYELILKLQDHRVRWRSPSRPAHALTPPPASHFPPPCVAGG